MKRYFGLTECLNQLNKIAQRLGYQFNDQELLHLAFTHSSYHSELNNQRLEFLGDSILSMVMSDYLYNNYPAANEGDLTRIRSNLVKEAPLALIARSYEIQQGIILGAGEAKTHGQDKDSILADTLEAIIGAIYLDSDLATTVKLIVSWYVEQNYFADLDSLVSSLNIKDPKTELQELLHARGEQLPEYQVIKITGKPHKQTFKVACKVASLGQIIYATGSSRKKAEQNVAKKILELLS